MLWNIANVGLAAVAAALVWKMGQVAPVHIAVFVLLMPVIFTGLVVLIGQRDYPEGWFR